MSAQRAISGIGMRAQRAISEARMSAQRAISGAKMSARRASAALGMRARRMPRGAALAVGALLVSHAVAQAAASREAPAALLVFPLVQVEAGSGLDTLIRLTNTGSEPQPVRCLYLDAAATPALAAFQMTLAPQQPIAWRAGVGLAALPLAGAGNDGSVPPVPVAPFTGTLRCAAAAADGTPVARDVLLGSASLERSAAAPDAATYAAIGFAATGATADAPEVLVLGGPMAEYGACPAELSLQPLLDGASIALGSGDPLSREATTTIALATCSSTRIGGGATASLTLTLTTELGQTITATRSLRELLVSDLSRLDTANPATSIFRAAVAGAPSGSLRIVPNPGSGVLAVAVTTYRDPAGVQPAARAALPAQLLGDRTLPDLIDLSAPTPTPPPSCAGDCDGDGAVTINELITGVNIALGTTSVAQCTAFDTDGDGLVAINELIAAVARALDGC